MLLWCSACLATLHPLRFAMLTFLGLTKVFVLFFSAGRRTSRVIPTDSVDPRKRFRSAKMVASLEHWAARKPPSAPVALIAWIGEMLLHVWAWITPP